MGLDTVDGLRARKKERTRHDLLNAGLRMIAKRGFDAVTVEDIAAEVEVSPRTFYRYFTAKEDLVLDDQAEIFDLMRASFLAQPPDLTAMSAVRAALLEVARTFEAPGRESLLRARILDATPSLKMRQTERQTAWEQALAPLLSERIGDPPGAPSMRAELMASCAVAALRVAFAAWRAADGEPSLSALVAATLDLLDDNFGQQTRRRRR